MVRYLGEKNIINSEECFKYYEDNIKNILNEIKENDKKEAQKAFEEYNEKYKKEKADFIEKVDD